MTVTVGQAAVEVWAAEREALRAAGLAARGAEACRRVGAYIAGWSQSIEHAVGWSLAGRVGEATPTDQYGQVGRVIPA